MVGFGEVVVFLNVRFCCRFVQLASESGNSDSSRDIADFGRQDASIPGIFVVSAFSDC